MLMASCAKNEDIQDEQGDLSPITYFTQPYYPLDLDKGKDKLPAGSLLVYLDVWERHLTYIEVESADGSVISIREVALGGPDTATRAQVVWQVKATNKMSDENNIPDALDDQTWRNWVEGQWSEWIKKWQPTNRGQLKAKGKEDGKKDTDPCITSPEASYRGAENQLYRVEIHRSGTAWNGEESSATAATFEWSRDNGSVTFPIRRLTTDSDSKTTTIALEHLGRDDRYGLVEGNWVEIQDDDSALRNLAKPLLRVIAIDRTTMTVTLSGLADSSTGQDPAKHPLLRRWDHKAGNKIQADVPKLAEDGTLFIEEGKWLTLEDGVQIYFEPGATYRTGDYWLIPARVATGDVEWPGPVGDPEAQAPHGIEHHYAPLAIISVANSSVNLVTDLRNKIKPLVDR